MDVSELVGSEGLSTLTGAVPPLSGIGLGDGVDLSQSRSSPGASSVSTSTEICRNVNDLDLESSPEKKRSSWATETEQAEKEQAEREEGETD